MGRDGDFKTHTKDVLAKRSGYRCNNPACRRMTVGAHSDLNKFVSLGQACHIEAASPGGPRYNPMLTTEERQKISNGIWLCCSCSKLIDSDPDRFTVEVLNEWKRHAEDWNLREAAIQSVPDSVRIISVANIAGGTGKSTATAIMGRAISSQMHKRVLVVSAHPSDHALYFLNGYNMEAIRQEKEEKKKRLFDMEPGQISPMELQNEIVHLEFGVDALPYQSLYNLAFQQQLCLGESSIKEILTALIMVSEYQVVVCDCGRGDEDLQKAILNFSTDIAVPIGKRSWFESTVRFLMEYGMQTEMERNVWFLQSIGENKYISDRLIPQMEKFSTVNSNAQIIETVVPSSKNLPYVTLESPGAIKNVLSAYRKIVCSILESKFIRGYCAMDGVDFGGLAN